MPRSGLAYAQAVVAVVVLHHTLGLTAPVLCFADELRAAGHTIAHARSARRQDVRRYEDGAAHFQALGGPMAAVERARAEVESLPSDLFYVGLSSGVLAAQSLAQTRPGASGAVLCHSAVALGEWGPELARSRALPRPRRLAPQPDRCWMSVLMSLESWG